MTLVIMAAGMGSRFGGLKQIEPIDEYGNFIIDYSIYDAIKVGFKKVVFIIKKENYDIFRETVGARVEKYIDVEYAFQELDALPSGYSVPGEQGMLFCVLRIMYMRILLLSIQMIFMEEMPLGLLQNS